MRSGALRRRVAVALAVVAGGVGCAVSSDTVTLVTAILPGELPAYRAVVNEFEQMTGTRVVVVPQQYADVRRAIAAETAAGQGTIDLVELDVYSLAAAAGDVAVLDASSLRSILEVLEPAAVRAGMIDGPRFLPHRMSWQAMIYDHATLGAPPATWDELVAVARAHPGKIGFKGSLYEGLTCDVLPFVWSAGGDGVTFDDAGARAAFGLFRELAPYVNQQSATFKEGTIVEAMARGELVLHLNWPFAMSVYASQGLAPDRIRSAPLPWGPAGRATVLGGGYLGIPRYAPHPARARALLEYLLSRETQTRLGRELGWFSARRDVPIAAGGETLAGFVAMRDAVRPRPERPDYVRRSRAWQRAFRAVVFDGDDPEQALRDAARDAGDRG